MTRVVTVFGIEWGRGKNCEKLYWRLIIHMSSTGNAEQLAAVSCELSALSRSQCAYVRVSRATASAFVTLQRGQECPLHATIALHQ
jgi:hypothetical protein